MRPGTRMGQGAERALRVRDTSKAQLLDAALVLLSSDAVGGVQKLLSPEALQEKTREANADGVSRHTAYRLWEDRGEAVIDLARHIAELNLAGAPQGFARVVAIQVDVLTRYEAEGRSVVDMDRPTMRAGMREMNRGVFEGQLGASEVAATWTLHGAALTSSRLWQGRPPDEDLARVGHEVLVARGTFYAEVKRLWCQAYDGLLSWWGRRIRPDHRVEALTDLVVALFDGLVLQMFVDPELNDADESADAERRRRRRAQEKIDDASDALFEVFWAYSEPVLRDPRRTLVSDPASFDQLVATATRLAADDPDAAPVVAEVARAAGVAVDVAATAFPHPGDLADSVLRRLIAPAGLELGIGWPTSPVPLIELALRRTHRVAREHPSLVAVARASAAEADMSFLAELRAAIAEALGAPAVATPRPAETADLLVDLTLDRDDRWANVETLLSVLEAATGRA